MKYPDSTGITVLFVTFSWLLQKWDLLVNNSISCSHWSKYCKVLIWYVAKPFWFIWQWFAFIHSYTYSILCPSQPPCCLWKYILLDKRLKKCKLKASQIHLKSAVTMTDWCCCSHGARLQNGLLLFTNAASALKRQRCSVYAKVQRYFHRNVKKVDRQQWPTVTEALWLLQRSWFHRESRVCLGPQYCSDLHIQLLT